MKKYQVFISSTFTDLIEERQAAVEAILQAGHIPAGMELFAASNKSQWEIIKKWIDESDIYMLILGGRYGSIEPESGLSYTELEYKYACEIDKPLFALVLHDDFIEQKVQKQGAKNILELNESQKLKNFSTNILSKLCKICSDYKDIKLGVFQSINFLEKEYKLTGWLRASQQVDYKTNPKKDVSIEYQLDLGNLSNGDDNWTFNINFHSDSLIHWQHNKEHEQEVILSWNKIFALVSPAISSDASEYEIHKTLEDSLRHVFINDIKKFCDQNNFRLPKTLSVSKYYFDTILIQLQTLNLIKKSEKRRSVNDQGKYWSLTEYGEKEMLKLRSIKKEVTK